MSAHAGGSIKRRVMVVDDERDILAILKQGLEDCGFLADGFTNPDRALKQFARDAAYYDLVITDIRMPGMSGYELAARVREISKTVKIVLMTAFDIDRRAWPSTIHKVEISAVIGKPFSIKQLCSKVEALIANTNRKG